MIEHNHFIFIAQQLHTVIRVFSPDHQLLENVNYSLFEGKVPALPDSICNYLFHLVKQGTPLTALINQKDTYTVFHTPDKILVIGPNRVYHNMDYLHHMDTEEADDFPEEQVYKCSLLYYIQIILPSYNLYFEKMITEETYQLANFHSSPELEVQENFSDLVFQNREENTSHNPYSQEKRMLSSIEQGDLAMLEECRRKEIKQNFGVLSPDLERNCRNLGICAITLVSRAAIRGGVNAELAFSLCDSYIMEIEHLKDVYDLEPLVEKAKINFCTMVKEQKEHKQSGKRFKQFHPLVEKTKDYIFSHLHGKITLYEVAESLHVNANYLSDLFKKYEGIPFSNFVTDEKLKLVKNLLVYSNYSYIEIASYLGFTSQSYLGKQFKEYTGMTLREYRNLYGSNEFKESI